MESCEREVGEEEPAPVGAQWSPIMENTSQKRTFDRIHCIELLNVSSHSPYFIQTYIIYWVPLEHFSHPPFVNYLHYPNSIRSFFYPRYRLKLSTTIKPFKTQTR